VSSAVSSVASAGPKRQLVPTAFDVETTSEEESAASSRSSSAKRLNLDMAFTFGVSTLQNTRLVDPEDRVIELLGINDTKVSLFGVVDGHGGSNCASFVSHILPRVISEEVARRLSGDEPLLDETWGSVLEDSFLRVSQEWDCQGIPTSGAVATVVLVSKRSCLVAHAGDCKVIASLADDSYVELTRDHRCSDPDEARRVEEAGGVIFNGRVEGRLLPSRAFGDINVRMAGSGALLDCISPEPELCYHHVEDNQDGFVIVASDGLFDVVPCAKAVHEVRKILKNSGDPREAADRLVNLASKRTSDDISVVVLAFKGASA